MTDTSASSTADARELPLPSGAMVDIYLTSGTVRLRGTDEERIVVRATDGEPLGDDIALETEREVVRIRDAQSSWKLGPFNVSSRRSRDLAIDVPRTAVVAVRTLSGDVDASGIGSDSRWASASGQLHLSVDGGRVQLETMSGDAVLEASGPITLGGRTVSGDLRVRAPQLDGTELSTTSGDVRIEGALRPGAGHVINSVSGDVELVTTSPVRLQVETIAGDVHAFGRHEADGSRGRRTLVAGDGSVAVSVRTTSGDVRLHALERDPAAKVATAPDAPVARVAPAPVAPVRPAAPAAPVAPVPPVGPAATSAPVAPIEPVPPAAPVASVAARDDEPALRPIDDEEDTHAWNAAGPIVDRREADRLEVLRALERGDLDIETAARRLEILEQAGPRYFRGWC